MKKYNQELLNHIYRICEKSGAVKNVDQEYYNSFLNIEKGMEAIIECIIRDRTDYVKRQCLSKKWTTDEEIYEHLMFYLDMIAHGIIGISEENGKLVFNKPVGPPPDAETEIKIDQKIKNTIPLIKKVFLKTDRIKQVLIVDDEESFLSSIAEGLSVYRKYFNLRTALNGAEAVKILKLSPIDLVITDLSMPVMDGFELLAYMNRNYPKIPVMLMTAYSTPKIKEIVSNMGIFRYLEKPLYINDLAENIFNALGIKPPEAFFKKTKITISENQRKNILEYVDSADNLVKGLYHPAILFANEGRYNEAIFCLREMLERSTDMQEKVECLYTLGQIMEQMNEFEDAISYYQEASALCIANSDISYWINNNIGFSLCMLGRFIEAEKYCRQAIEIDTNRSNAFKNLGLSLEGQGRLRESIDAYITATKINAKDVRALNLFEKLLNKHPELKDKYNESLKECKSIVEKAYQHHEKPKQLH